MRGAPPLSASCNFPSSDPRASPASGRAHSPLPSVGAIRCQSICVRRTLKPSFICHPTIPIISLAPTPAEPGRTMALFSSPPFPIFKGADERHWLRPPAPILPFPEPPSPYTKECSPPRVFSFTFPPPWTPESRIYVFCVFYLIRCSLYLYPFPPFSILTSF